MAPERPRSAPRQPIDAPVPGRWREQGGGVKAGGGQRWCEGFRTGEGTRVRACAGEWVLERVLAPHARMGRMLWWV